MPVTGFPTDLGCGTAQVLIGLALGMLLAAVGLALHAELRKAPRLTRAIHAIGWTTGVFLLVAAALLWLTGRGPCTPALYPALMAAFVAPPLRPRQHSYRWRDLTRTLLAALAAGGAYAITSGWLQAGWAWPDAPGLVELGGVLFGGLAARLLSEALSALVSAAPIGKLFDVLYACGTFVVGTSALYNLGQHGVAWNAPAETSGLVSVWLTWSAAWISPRGRRRLRAALVAAAALLLIATTLCAGPAGIGLLSRRAP